MTNVIVESPYKGNIFRNTQFAKNVCRSLALEGYNPFASHIFYTQFLNEDDPEERKLGINLGFHWGAACCPVVFFCVREPNELDHSEGMSEALRQYRMLGKVTILRVYRQDGTFIREEEI